MVSKISSDGRPYEITGKWFVWHPEDDEGDRGNLPDVRIPLRLKLKTILAMSGQELDTESMTEILTAIAPGQMEAMEEMDVNDFQDMFSTWQTEYNSVSGGSLGESSASPASSLSTVAPSSTTSAPVSA